jgi:ABC-type transport system involved in multi-copper enzyme maturation permease subunit
MMRAFAILTWNGFREARRNRVTILIVAFTIALVLSAVLLTEATVTTFDRVLVDFGLGSMSLMMVFLVLFLSTGLVSREIERRTIYLVVSKPVSRGVFVVSRLAGNMLTLGAVLVGMVVVFCVEVRVYGLPIRQNELISIVGLWFELLILSSVGILLSSFSNQIVAAVVTAGTFFVGHLSADLYNLSKKGHSQLVRSLGRAVYYVLPNLERLNFRPQASHNLPVPQGEFLSAMLYACCYSVVLVALAVAIFQRRDFK